MASEVSICNHALALLGAQAITSLDDPTTQAQLCKRLYPVMRDDVLSLHPWSFATKIVKLSKLTDPPNSPYSNAFQLPLDMIRLLDVSSGGSFPEEYVFDDYSVAGETICADEDDLWIKYIQRVEDPAVYPPYFSSALGVKLASELALPIVESRELWGNLAEMFERRLSDAYEADTTFVSMKKRRRSRLINLR